MPLRSHQNRPSSRLATGSSTRTSCGWARPDSAGRSRSSASCSAISSTSGAGSRQEYHEGLALAQLAPGPLAAQLAMYLGYVLGGIAGATLVVACFILPSFLMVWAISVAYVRFGGLPWMQALFYGVGAAVIGIIARSAYKLTRADAGRNALLWAIFAVMAVATAWTEREIVWLFLLAGLVTALRPWRQASHSRHAPAAAACSARSRPGRGCQLAAVAWNLFWSSPRPARSCSAAAWRSCRFSTAAGAEYGWLNDNSSSTPSPSR